MAGAAARTRARMSAALLLSSGRTASQSGKNRSSRTGGKQSRSAENISSPSQPASAFNASAAPHRPSSSARTPSQAADAGSAALTRTRKGIPSASSACAIFSSSAGARGTPKEPSVVTSSAARHPAGLPSAAETSPPSRRTANPPSSPAAPPQPDARARRTALLPHCGGPATATAQLPPARATILSKIRISICTASERRGMEQGCGALAPARRGTVQYMCRRPEKCLPPAKDPRAQTGARRRRTPVVIFGKSYPLPLAAQPRASFLPCESFLTEVRCSSPASSARMFLRCANQVRKQSKSSSRKMATTNPLVSSPA